MESIPDHRRHGPADVEFPPPGGPWEPLALNGRLVGRAERAGLGAVFNLALPHADRNLPSEAVVLGSEPALVEAFSRTQEWMGGQRLSVAAELVGTWWKVSVGASGPRKPLPVPEMGEPLIRLIV